MDRQESEYYRHIRGETVTQLLFRYLELEGVETIFGIPGKPIQESLNVLQRRSAGPWYVLCRHEGRAAFMADGYARTTGPESRAGMTGQERVRIIGVGHAVPALIRTNSAPAFARLLKQKPENVDLFVGFAERRALFPARP